MSNFKCTYSDLVEIILNSNFDVEKCIVSLKSSNSTLDFAQQEELKRYLCQTFIPHFRRRWQDCNRTKKHFYGKYQDWLANTYSLELFEPCSSSQQGGRPEKSFEECSDRTKRMKIKQILDNVSSELLTAASKKCHSKKLLYTPERALALIIDASLSKHDYTVLRQSSKEIGNDIFPPYDQVLNQKKLCYPTEIDISETLASVKLQALLDHTAKRLFLTKLENFEPSMDSFVLLCKWGCDGSSGHSQYKQTFENEGDTDANIFLTSLVPLRLIAADSIVWENPRPSSTRFCRPIRFIFSKETPDVVREEVTRMEQEISNLKETTFSINDRPISVTHSLVLSMIDGKVSQALTHTASMAVCPICKAKPTEMNRLELLKSKPVYEEAIKFGLSPLHARIKFMECILHIAYNMDFKKWRSDKQTKQVKEHSKKIIQEKFKRVLGLQIDVVKQGMGTTNDGNTSRRFFEDPAITSDITGVDKSLIHRFKIILDTINSGASIDPQKFEQYCKETLELYVELYNWYYMPNTVHKILFHGSTIISASMLPIGLLSEEAQEARNKDYRSYRREHSRKNNRINTNEDVFNFLTVSSDPYINMFRAEPKTKKKLDLHDDSKLLLC